MLFVCALSLFSLMAIGHDDDDGLLLFPVAAAVIPSTFCFPHPEQKDEPKEGITSPAECASVRGRGGH